MRWHQWLYRLPLLLRSVLHRSEVHDELDEEIRFHIEQQTQLNIESGMTPTDARRAALRAFGNVDARKEECHDHWAVAAYDHFTRDLRLALRRLNRERSFTLGVVLLLALGIGASVAVVSIIDGVLLKPLDYSNPDRLMMIREFIPEQDTNSRAANPRHYLEWTQCSCFSGVALSEYPQRLNLHSDGTPATVTALRVTANAFDVLGVAPQLGRSFVAEDAPGSNQSGNPAGNPTNVIISDRLWRNEFGGDSEILGRQVSLDAVSYTVVGVLPPNFQYFPATTTSIDVFAAWPLEVPPWWRWTNNYSYGAVARLADGVSAQAAFEQLAAIQAGIAADHFTDNAASLSLEARLIPIHEWVTERSRASLYLLLAAVAAALLIACLNIANLMLVRAGSRVREAGVRAALGATPIAIFRSVFIESAVLALGGAVIGTALAWAAIAAFTRLAATSMPRAAHVDINFTALLAAAALCIAATLLFGLLPAVRLTRVDPERALESGGRTSTASAGSVRGRQALVSAEVGLSVTLMIVAGLLLASYLRVDAVERGFDASNVLTAAISLPGAQYANNDTRLQFWNALREQLLNSPGVRAAGFTSILPLRGNFWGSTAIREGEDPPAHERPRVQYRFVSEGYFEAMGLPLLRGRHLEARDYQRGSAVISQQTASLLWRDANPLGRRFHWNDPELLFEVVGVVQDVHSANLESEPALLVYRPFTATGDGFVVQSALTVALRMTGEPEQGIGVLRAAIAELDDGIAISDIRTMQQIERAAVGERRVQLYLVGAFGLASLLIAALGIYSVLAYSVSARRHELALRMTLGADRGSVQALVLRQGMKPVLIGIVLGVTAAMVLGSVIASLLFDVATNDSTTLLSVIGITFITAILASLIPARRAASTSLLTALRYE